jgi:hypothetical protein
MKERIAPRGPRSPPKRNLSQHFQFARTSHLPQTRVPLEDTPVLDEIKQPALPNFKARHCRIACSIRSISAQMPSWPKTGTASFKNHK